MLRCAAARGSSAHRDWQNWGNTVDTLTTNVPSSIRNGHDSAIAHRAGAQPRARRAGWFFDALAHIETGLLIGIPLAPVAATFATVVMYIDPVEPSFWRLVSASVPAVLMFPLNIVIVWLALGIPLAALRLGTAMRANSSSHAQLTSRLITIEPYRRSASSGQDGPDHDSVLTRQLDFVWKELESKGTKWMLGDGFISLWRLVDRMDASLNYVMPRDRVWARAQSLLLWLPNPSSASSGVPDVREQLTKAIAFLENDQLTDPAAEDRVRGSVAQIQALIDSSKTDRYGGFIRARTMLLASCSMTSVALYGIFWLGIVALPAKVSQPILSAALFFTTIGALVGLFQLLYAESQSETAIDDYGLSVARLLVAPQLAALAALVGVVLTSLATSTLSGSPTAPVPAPTTIAAALDQIRNPANVLVAVAFALSPGLVFSRFRQNIEQTKRDLSRTSSASIVHT